MQFRPSFVLLLALVAAGCSHVSYTRTWDNDSIDANDHGSPLVDGFELEHQSNHIVLLDRTGAVCASIGSMTEGLANAAEARNEAEKEGDSTYTWEYRQHSPAEYAGIECGAAYRWGNGGGTFSTKLPDNDFTPPPGYMPQGYDVETRSTEFDVHLGATLPFFQQTWLRYSFNWRLGMGRYKVKNIDEIMGLGGFPESTLDNDDSKFFFRSPFLFGLKFYPRWLFGFGIEGDVAFDPLMLAFAKRWNRFYEHFNYGARAGFYLPFARAFAFGVYGGLELRNIAWADYIVRTDSWGIGASFDVNFSKL